MMCNPLLYFVGGDVRQVTRAFLRLLDPDPDKRLDLVTLEKLSRDEALWEEKST